MEAINLYLKAGLPAKAARLALSKEVRIFCRYFLRLNQNLSVKRRGKDFEFNSIGFVRIYRKKLVKSILFVNFERECCFWSLGANSLIGVTGENCGSSS